MVDQNSKPSDGICPKCGKNGLHNPKTVINIPAVTVKLKKALESVEMALEACNESEQRAISTHINCAKSYLFEAADKAGKTGGR